MHENAIAYRNSLTCTRWDHLLQAAQIILFVCCHLCLSLRILKQGRI